MFGRSFMQSFLVVGLVCLYLSSLILMDFSRD